VCRTEAVGLEQKQLDFETSSGLDIQYLYFLLEDGDKNPPGAGFSRFFADELSLQGFPVLSDAAKAIATATGRDPKKVPGKCVVSPSMQILGCYGGADDAKGYELIVADVQK